MISHKLNEIAEIADTTTIIRDGRTVETLSMVDDEVTQERIIRGMVGRDLDHRFPPHDSVIGEEVLRIENWTVHHPTQPERVVVDDASLSVRAGEIVGLAGLMGAGRTELAMSVFGRSYGRDISGKVFLHGKEIRTRTVDEAIEHGIAYATEDRKKYGLNLIEDIRTNISSANLDQISALGLRERQRGDQGRGGVPPEHEHPGTFRDVRDGQALRRQPAEGRAEQVALHRSAGADPRRADTRHRRRGQVRDLHADQQARRRGPGRHPHLLGAARAHRHVRPDLHALGRPGHRCGRQAGRDTGTPDGAHDEGKRSGSMTTAMGLKDLFTRNLRQSGIYIAFILIVGLFTLTTHGVLLSPGNVTNIVLQSSYVLILAIGMVIVIIGGHIDLSVGSLVALTGSVSAILVIRHGQPWWVGVLAGLGVGLLCGMWQGFWVAAVGIPSFIVTLAGMLIFRGMTLKVLSNVSLSPFPADYQHIAGGFMNGFLGGNGYDVFTLVIGAVAVVGYAVSQVRTRQGRIRYQQLVESMPLFIAKIVIVGVVVMAFMYQLSRSRGLPVVLVILGVLVIAYSILTTKTKFGRHVYAIGGNLSAAQLSGVKVPRVNFLIFVNMGLLAAVAGVVYSSRSNSAQPGCRQHVRARRDRGVLHRRSVDDRRRRTGHRARSSGRCSSAS